MKYMPIHRLVDSDHKRNGSPFNSNPVLLTHELSILPWPISYRNPDLGITPLAPDLEEQA
jgi:hypothetical protein